MEAGTFRAELLHPQKASLPFMRIHDAWNDGGPIAEEHCLRSRKRIADHTANRPQYVAWISEDELEGAAFFRPQHSRCFQYRWASIRCPARCPLKAVRKKAFIDDTVSGCAEVPEGGDDGVFQHMTFVIVDGVAIKAVFCDHRHLAQQLR